MAHKRRSTSHHFFKPLIPGFLSNFCIPKSFLKHLSLEESTNENDFIAVLKDPSCAGNGEDKSWLVQVDGNGRRFLDGRNEFADDHFLRVGEFILFNHLGDFVFKVTVFDPVTACPRSFSAERIGCAKPKEKKSTPPKRSMTFKPSENPYFLATVQEYCFHTRTMNIPIQFARDNELVGRSCEMTLMDNKNRPWPVTLKHTRLLTGGDVVRLSTGWAAMAKAHGLKGGDPVVYELLDSGSHPIMRFYKFLA